MLLVLTMVILTCFPINKTCILLIGYYPMCACAAKGRVIVLSVGRSVCLSVCLFVCLHQDFERSRLVYGLYLLYMSQKLKNIRLHIPHE